MIRPLRERAAELTRQELQEIAQAIIRCGSVSKAAKELNVHRNTLYYKLRKEVKGPITTTNLRLQFRITFCTKSATNI